MFLIFSVLFYKLYGFYDVEFSMYLFIDQCASFIFLVIFIVLIIEILYCNFVFCLTYINLLFIVLAFDFYFFVLNKCTYLFL